MSIIQCDDRDLRAIIRDEMEAVIRRMSDKPVSRSEAAAILGVSVRTIDAMVRRGQLHRLPVPGQPRFSENAVRGLKPSDFF